VSQTKEGVEVLKATMIEKYGSYEAYCAFMRSIGAKGGKLGKNGGFAAGEAGRDRARKYGAIGGRISRRRSK